MHKVNPGMVCGMDLLLRKVTKDHVKYKEWKTKKLKKNGRNYWIIGWNFRHTTKHSWNTFTALSTKWFVIIFSQLCDLDSIHLVRWTNICCFNNPASWIRFVISHCISTTYRIMNQHHHLDPVSREPTMNKATVDQELAEWSSCILQVWCAKNSWHEICISILM